jgi:unsaturated rhamnogalacturonyl hydrolase
MPLLAHRRLLRGFYCRCILGIAVLGFAIPLSMAAADSPNQRLTPADVLSVMERVADWQLAHPSVHSSTEWTQSAGDVGMMALAGISGDPKYRDALLAMGEANGWKPGPRIYHADDLAIGQAYAGLYFLYRDRKMIAPLRTRLDAVLSAPPAVQTLDFHQPYDQVSQLWSWCDSLFMAPPVWMQLFAATGDERYLDFAVKNWWRTTDYLYDPVEHLYYRDSTYFDRREANGEKVFWSRGNGWVMAGLVRMLQLLPAKHPSRARFQQLFHEMAEKILTAQQPDGLWHSSLLDPQSYPLKETSGSSFYAYALAWGVNQGLLDGAKFKPAVRRAWTALADCVDAEGKLTHVQPVGADPKTFADDSTEVYGVGAFLLAGSELYRMVVFEKTQPLAIRVTNPLHLYRHCETVELSLSRLTRRGLRATNLAAMDGLGSRILDSQIYGESGQAPDTFLFQADLAPGDTRTYYILDASALAAVPQPILKTYARQIDEHYRDMAWESDRIAHRIYHRDLIQAEGTVSSGVDVWVKSTRALVINNWYKNGDYHNDHGGGLDDYRVGRSRGCGGLGIWDRQRYFVSSNYRSARIITTGPVRSEFELTYDAWEAGKGKISETKRIRIDAGSNMTRAESVFAADSYPDFDIGIGIAQRPGDGVIAKNQEEGWMSYWQPTDRDRGSIGCAIVMPGKIEAFATESATLPKLNQADLLTPTGEGLPPVANLLAISAARVGKPFLYYFGAGWSKSGDFLEETDWENYVRQFVDRLRAPLKVTLENE